MKQKVIEFFQNLPEAKHEQFNKAFELYRQSEGKSLGAEKMINAVGYTPASLENLLYDLQKLHDISDVEKFKIADNSEQIAELESEKEDLVFENEDLKDENEELKSVLRQAQDDNETLKLAPKLDAKAIRVEFPFLNDAACPDELKILMADKISAWNNYIFLQEEMSKIESGEIIARDETKANLAKNAVKAFNENKKIYDELNAYATTGKVLGLHPIFKKLQLTREVEEMTADELIKYKSSSAKYFSVNKTALAKAKKAKDEAKALEITNRVADRHDKLFLVNKKLGV